MSHVDRPGLAKIAFIGNALPRRCGIATFTSDIHRAVRAVQPSAATGIVAMNDGDNRYRYPADVVREIADGVPEDYAAAAAFLNRERYDVVSLQHEFGIFGGPAGAHILVLLELLTMPVVTTFHTVLADPSPAQREAVCRIGALSTKVIVMAEKGVDLLVGVYGLQRDKIAFVPHGIPDVPFAAPDAAKAARGFAGRKVVLTFGLLSANKGIETMIDAMPKLLERCPSAVYVVLSATHPNRVRAQGETYRDALRARASKLGVADKIVFENGFVDHDTLLSYISMCDVYVTPYLNAAQMTSGTLAYSFGLGRAVVSTPYWHARELLADGGGVLVPFGDSAATGEAVAGLLTDDAARDAMRIRAYRASRSMVWARVAERYSEIFAESLRPSRAKVGRRVSTADALRLPMIRLDHLFAMCDDTGLFQHALHSIPDRAHGYCVDDNARALILAVDLAQAGVPVAANALGDVFAAFLQHAWNPALGRFRNFLGFDRQWREEAGGRFVRASAAGGGFLRVAARLGLRAFGYRCDAHRRSNAGGRRETARRARRTLGSTLRGRRNAGVAMVRGRFELRQCTPCPGLDRCGPQCRQRRLDGPRCARLALACGGADRPVRPFSPRRHRELRREPSRTARVRPAAARSDGDDFGGVRGVAGHGRRRLARDGQGRVLVVPRPQRFARRSCRRSDRGVPRRLACRPRERKPRR